MNIILWQQKRSPFYMAIFDSGRAITKSDLTISHFQVRTGSYSMFDALAKLAKMAPDDGTTSEDFRFMRLSLNSSVEQSLRVKPGETALFNGIEWKKYPTENLP